MGRSCVVGPRRVRSETSDDQNIEYSPSGTSSTSPVSPPHTFYDINSMLSIAGGSMCGCPQSPPSPPPLRPFSQGPRWGLPQKLDPLHHYFHHLNSHCVGKRCQVTVDPVAISCIRFYRPAMVVIFVVVVAVFVNVFAVVVFGAGRPPNGPLSPCNSPNGENTKASIWITNNDNDPNDRSLSWVIRQ